MKIYLISGLGADYRAFEKLDFPAEYELVHIPWMDMLADETLAAYSKRMAEKITPNEAFILGGLSFGGMVAVEISKFLKPEKLFLFSTVGTKNEIPWYYRLAGQIKLYKLLPKTPVQPFLPFLFWFFGPLDQPGRNILRYFSRLSKPYFLKWALTQISVWQNTRMPEHAIHIHGDLDRAFPIKCLKSCAYVIEGAGHMAIYTHADKVNMILQKSLHRK